MIVCDSHVAFLALAGAIQFTPETLVNTGYEQLTVVLGLRRERGEDVLGVFKSYLRDLGNLGVDDMLALASDPDPSVLLIADVSRYVGVAAEFATEHRISPTRSLLLALARELNASFCMGEKDNKPVEEAAAREEIPIHKIARIEPPGGANVRDRPRHDRRRPALLMPTT